MRDGSHFKLNIMINYQNQINILNENKNDMSLVDYHFYSKENDPTYLTWLFGSESGIEDYGQKMTVEQKEELNDFENHLQSY